MKKVLAILISMLLLCFVPSLSGERSVDSGPELEMYVCNGFQLSTFYIHVKNIGDETAHNVHITNATVEGRIFFNFQESHLRSYDIEPNGLERLSTNSMVFGLGNFTFSVTITCDEGTTVSSSVVGLIIGPIMLIP
jgi:hypothetical protein